MRRGIVVFSALTLVGFGLTGCGLFRFEQREPWRAQAEEACLAQQLVQPSAYMARTSKIDGPGICGMDYPFQVAAFAGGSVGLKKQVTLACPIIPRIETWLEETVRPAAVMYFGVPVVDLTAGTYSCRPRNNQSGAKISEHAFGNAMDVMAFVLADGREVTVAKGWRGDPAEQDFLREVFVGACRHFTTVLGPGADPFHFDHFHIDLARHDPRGDRRICKPILKFTPRLDSENRQLSQLQGRANPETADLAPVDMEQDGFAEEAPVAAQRLTPAPSVPRATAPYPQPSFPSQSLPPKNPYPPAATSETYRGPVYSRPQTYGQPQISGHGLY